MRGLELLSLSLLMPTLALAIQFTNPPPYDGTKSYSTNSIYEEGSLLHIKWSAKAQNNTSLTLWQLNGSQFLQPFEYLTQGVSGSVTSLDWTVQTTKNLTFSNMFYLCLFIEGDLTSLANSHFFNISSKVEVSSSSSSTTTGAATITTGSTALGIPIPTTSIYSSSPTTMAATFVASSDTSTGMSTGIKAAIGVGASAAGIFIVGFAWFCITRQRSKPSPLPPKDFVDLPILHSLYGEREKRTLDSDHKQSSVYELSSNPYYPPPRFEFPAIS